MITKKLSRREKIELEISQKQAQLKDLDAREKVKERKRETRRKIIVGALVLQHSAINDNFKMTIDRLINDHVTSSTDRDLFNLPLVTTEGNKGVT